MRWILFFSAFSSCVSLAAPVTIDLEWDGVTGPVAGYNVYRSRLSDGIYSNSVKLNNTLIPHDSTPPQTYSDVTADDADTYIYTVRTVNQSGFESFDSNPAQWPTLGPMPIAPTLLRMP